tara:strand:+ start:449 stop:592 length:144 start_codon:yes stop_codon:yes gene_type:complete
MSQLLYKPRVSTRGNENALKVIVVAFMAIIGLGLYKSYQQRKEETTS